MFEQEPCVSESLELKDFDHIIAEIQAEMQKLEGTSQIKNQLSSIARVMHRFRNLFESKYSFLSSPAKSPESDSKIQELTENTVHKKRTLLRFYLDFIQKDIPQLLKTFKNVNEFMIFFAEKQSFVMEIQNISLGFLDTIKFNNLKRRVLAQMYLHLLIKNKKEEKMKNQ